MQQAINMGLKLNISELDNVNTPVLSFYLWLSITVSSSIFK